MWELVLKTDPKDLLGEVKEEIKIIRLLVTYLKKYVLQY